MKFFLITLIVLPLFALAQPDTNKDIVTANDAVSKILGKEVKYILMTDDMINYIEVFENGKIVKYSDEKLLTLIEASTKMKRQEIDRITKKAFDEEFEYLMKKGRR